MSERRPTIGFAGVGMMGHGMAKNIVEKGYELVVLGHRNREPVEDLVARGASEAADAADLAAQADIIHLCLTGSPQVESVVGAMLEGLSDRHVIVDTSTAEPPSTLALAERVAERGARYADAPLSRTPVEAEAGTLDTMVGADDETFALIEPVIRTWAANVIRTGEVGTGHTMKLLNNFVAMGYGALYAEALAVGAKAGVSAETFHAVIGSGRMRNGFYDTFMRYTIEGDRDAHRFTLANAHKDMRYLAAMVASLGALNPLGAAVRNVYAAAELAGRGQDYVPMLVDFVREQNGLPGAPDER